MVLKSFEDRLSIWKRLRDELVSKSDPIQHVINFWNSIPPSSRNIDPYDQSTWPDPWQMIEENVYCEYTKILAVAYTLMLSESSKDWRYEIHIGIDRDDSKLYYMLIANDKVIGLEKEKSVYIKDVPKSIHIQKIHVLSEQY